MFIDTQEELNAFCERAATARVLAVDTEFHREKTYFPILYLVQVATVDEVAVIDPLAIDDLAPLARLFEDDRITKVFHACSQDLEVIYDGMGCDVAPIFDTQIAASYLGMRQQSSLLALVEAYSGVHLKKAESLTDWSRRPLDPEQLAYAADDVAYLPDIYERMMAELVEKGRLSWAQPEMDAMIEAAKERRRPELAYTRLKRSGSLTRRQLAIAREIAAWRERMAAKRNVPRKRVITDDLIVETCRLAPKEVAQLARIRGTEQLSQRDKESIVAAVKRGLDTPAAQCPKMQHRTRPSAEVEGAVDLMYALVRIISDREGVALPLIASRDDLADFAMGKPDCKLAGGWRHELVGTQLERLLDGKLGLTVKNGRIEVL